MAVVALPALALSVVLTPAAVLPSRPNMPSPFSRSHPAIPLSLTPSLIPSPLPLLSAPSIDPAPIQAPLPTLRSLNSFWDGIRLDADDFADPDSVPALAAGQDESSIDPGPRTAPWLATDDPKLAAALDRAVELAQGTRAGRKAVEQAAAVLENNPLPVVSGALGRNFGEYDFVLRKMRLHRDLLQPGREADLAGTLVHELTHVVQHASGVPSNALEMEIEAHLQDLEMLRELGLEPPEGTFARQAFEALKESPRAFVRLIQSAVPATVYLGDSTMDEIVEQLETDLDEQREKKTKVAAGLVVVIERDLALLSSDEGRASYRAFARRVGALLRRRHAAARK